MTGQTTPQDLNLFMPTMCEVSWVAIRKDVVAKRHYQAKYDHTSPAAQELIPADKLTSLPNHLKGTTKDGNLEGDTEADHKEAFEKVLAWAWAKHTHFLSVTRVLK